jgi:hypothetical protein
MFFLFYYEQVELPEKQANCGTVVKDPEIACYSVLQLFNIQHCNGGGGGGGGEKLPSQPDTQLVI